MPKLYDNLNLLPVTMLHYPGYKLLILQSARVLAKDSLRNPALHNWTGEQKETTLGSITFP